MRWIAICLQSTKHTDFNKNIGTIRTLQRELSGLLSRFSPALVEHSQAHCPKKMGVLIEIERCFRLFGGAHQLLQALFEDTLTWQNSKPEVQTTLAAWETAQGAWWLARQRPASCLAELQTMHQEPSNYLDSLNTDCLDLTAQQAKLLDQCGIQTLKELNTLPRDAIHRRFGVNLLNELDKGYGRASDSRATYSPATTFYAEQEMPFHASSLGLILHTVSHLLVRLETWLKERYLASAELLWSFHQTHTNTQLHTRSSRLLQGHKDWLLLTNHQLRNRLFTDEVQHIELFCTHLEPFEAQTDSLLFNDIHLESEKWQGVYDQLQARLGSRAIVFPHLHFDPRPECSFSFQTNPDQKPKPQENQHELCPLHIRPLWLLKQPTRFEYSKQWHILSGPERIEFGWWDNLHCKRDYYRLINTCQQQAWVFRNLEAASDQEAWYLHGYFA